MVPAELKKKLKITRDDIATLLSSIGKTGQKKEEKFKAVKSLNRKNSQGYGIEQTLESYREF